MVRTVDRVVPAVRRASKMKVAIETSGLIITRFRKLSKRLIQFPLNVRVIFRSGDMFTLNAVTFAKENANTTRNANVVSMLSISTISQLACGVAIAIISSRTARYESKCVRIGQMIFSAKL